MAKTSADNDGMVPVTLPSGGLHFVHSTESAYWEERRQRYLSENQYTNVSDIQDLDKILIDETLMKRWGNWLSKGRDYWGEAVDANALQRALKDHSGEVRLLKQSIGMDKKTREKVGGEDSISARWEKLTQRAKSFGYMRNEQAAKAIELFQQLSAVITQYDNSDDLERIEFHCTQEDVIDWIRESAIPEFNEIDKAYRDTTQKYFIRDFQV